MVVQNGGIEQPKHNIRCKYNISTWTSIDRVFVSILVVYRNVIEFVIQTMLELSLKGLFVWIPMAITYVLGGVFPTNKRLEERYSIDIFQTQWLSKTTKHT